LHVAEAEVDFLVLPDGAGGLVHSGRRLEDSRTKASLSNGRGDSNQREVAP
jgi:hypothetical protein